MAAVRPFALTYPQLMNQALAQGLDTASLVRLRWAHDLAMEIGRDLYRAQGVPLLCHLVRTASIVLAEQQPLRVVLASLLHAADVRQRFDGGRSGDPPRGTLAQEIGLEAEALVRGYARLPWYSAACLERHVDRLDTYGDTERALLVMHLANELEDHLDRAMDCTPGERSRTRGQAYGPQAVALAERLGLPVLADELREAMGAATPRALPQGIVFEHRQAYGLGRATLVRRALRALRAGVDRAREITRQEGVRGVVFGALGRLGYVRCGWFARPLAPPWPSVDTDIAVDVGLVESLDEYRELRPEARDGQFRGRLDTGDRCFGARHAGVLISATWVATGRVRLSFGEVPLAPHEICLYDTFTAPAFRGRHVPAAICRTILECHPQHRQAVTQVIPENRSNVRSRERTGFRRTGTIHFVKLGAWRWHRLRGARA